jgi:hypothetical protein
LDRISDKFKIPMAQAEEAKPLQIGYNNLDQVKGILKRKVKPDCLRVMALPEGAYGWHYHADALGSGVVVLGSTDPDVLSREQEAKEAKAAGPDAPAATATNAQAKAEEEREERREQRAAVRRAQYDIPWLIFHTAEACGEQLQVAGAALEWMADLVIDHTNEPVGWAQYDELDEALIAAINDKARAKEHEALTRQMLLMRRLTDEIWTGYDPPKSYDWPRALEIVERQADEMKLRLPKGWDTPPVNKTETNCHVCGRFTSMDHVTQRNLEEGWLVEGKRVTCSPECRAELCRSSAEAKKANLPAAKKPAKKAKRK